MADNNDNNNKRPRTLYTVNHEKAEEYIKKADDRVRWFNEVSKKIKESGK